LKPRPLYLLLFIMTPTKAPSKGKQKRTYVLSSETLERFEAATPPGKRGVAVDEAINHWLEEQRLAKIRARMEEFFKDEESQALYEQIDRELSPASDEVWAQLPPEDPEDWPEPAIVFPNGLAAAMKATGS
jgi:hypothetical protein